MSKYSITIEEFYKNFDNLIDLVEGGESFVIKSEKGSIVLLPYQEQPRIAKKIETDDEFVRIHTDHEEGS